MRIDISEQRAFHYAMKIIRGVTVARCKFMRSACVNLRSLRVSVGVQ